jgi:hypothetical protein
MVASIIASRCCSADASTVGGETFVAGVLELHAVAIIEANAAKEFFTTK